MGKDDELHPTLDTALHLDGSPDAIRRFYADWAKRYDSDTADWEYTAPVNAVDMLVNLPDRAEVRIDPGNRDISIMDAGCGTGQLARLLRDVGYRNIDGFDLSAEMVERARSLGIYRHLAGNVDINAPVRSEWLQRYDCTICIGVFTPGHVPPSSLSQLVALTRPGGIVIVSTRVAYYDAEGFQGVSDALEDNGTLKLLRAKKNASYTNDEKAHYWLYAVLE